MKSHSPAPIEPLREQVDQLIAAGRGEPALGRLAELWQAAPGSAAANFVISRFEKIRRDVGAAACRMFVLRSFTVEPILPLLRAGAAVGCIDLEVQLGDFNTYVQEILDPSSPLYAAEPGVIVLAVQTRDITPQLWAEFADLSADEIDAEVQHVAGSFEGWVDTLRSRTAAHIIIHNLERPANASRGLLDGQTAGGQLEAIDSINRRLARLAGERTGVHVLGYDELIARHGRATWHDEQKWLTVRLPMRAEHLIHVADAWLGFVHPITGRTAKCLVCDLDNTLWGGVVGEDAAEGIKLGVEYPGAAYVQLQRALLDLHGRGILLAVCSKNNHDDAMEVIAEHPHMLLRPHHFAAMRINWNDKAQNLREIADELNIGMDVLAFIDDNPAECRLVRDHWPQVRVIELGDDPMAHAAAIRSCPLFERLTLSQEDRRRGQMYETQRQRNELQQSAGSLEDYYHSLEMEAEVAQVSPATLARVAQLTQKTNQFNMTTRRYSEQQIGEFAASADCQVFSVRVTDRFGDSGIVGVAITRQSGDTAELDTFLLSCRVIGRTIETAMLAVIADAARQNGAKHLAGWFVPTKKNAPAKEVYAKHGFAKTHTKDDAEFWQLDLTHERIEVPPWIKCTAMVEQTK